MGRVDHVHADDRIVWSAHTKDAVLQHAAANHYSAKCLPSVDVFSQLATLVSVPDYLGKTAYSRCLTKLASLIGHLVSEKSLTPLLIEQRQERGYRCIWTDVPVESLSLANIKTRGWLLLQAESIPGRTAVTSTNVSPASLVRQAVSQMIGQRRVRKEVQWVEQAHARRALHSPAAPQAVITTTFDHHPASCAGIFRPPSVSEDSAKVSKEMPPSSTPQSRRASAGREGQSELQHRREMSGEKAQPSLQPRHPADQLHQPDLPPPPPSPPTTPPATAPGISNKQAYRAYLHAKLNLLQHNSTTGKRITAAASKLFSISPLGDNGLHTASDMYLPEYNYVHLCRSYWREGVEAALKMYVVSSSFSALSAFPFFILRDALLTRNLRCSQEF